MKDIPDGYFYFPTELGGLEVQNSFIGLLQIRDTVLEDPNTQLDSFLKHEKEAYRSAKLRFEKRRTAGAKSRHDGFIPEDADTFFSIEEYTKYREELHYDFDNNLVDVHSRMLQKPSEQPINTEHNGNVIMALSSLDSRSGLKGILANWYTMEPYWKWVAQLYGPEMIDTFGGMSIVDPSLLPMGMVSEFKSGRVNWQE